MLTPDAAIESLHFKNRVLDFFDVFLRRPTPLALNLLLPLLHVVRGGGELGNKAAGILRTRLKGATASATTASAVSEEDATKVIDEIHALARRAPSAEFSSLCSAASLFAARLAPSPSLAAYTATATDFITRKHTSVHPAFVADYVRRQGARAWPLGETLLELCEGGKAANAYRHTQAYSLLGQLLAFAPASVKSAEIKQVDAEKLVKRAMADVYSVLESAAEGEWKADRLKDVVKFGLSTARIAHALSPESAAKLCDAQRLAKVGEKLKEGRTREMKGVLSLVAQLGAVLSPRDKKKEGKKGKGAQEKVEKMEVEEEKGEEEEEKGEEEEPKPAGKKRKAAATGKAAKGKGKKAKAE